VKRSGAYRSIVAFRCREHRITGVTCAIAGGATSDDYYDGLYRGDDAQAGTAAAATGEPVDWRPLSSRAQKRAENLQNVPISVTAITAQAIEDTHYRHLEALAGSVPDVQIGHSQTRRRRPSSAFAA